MPLQNWKSTNLENFFKSQDPSDIRWGNLVKSTSPLDLDQKSQFGLWGYADDMGITLNNGRVGARFAPDTIRRFFYKMTTDQTFTSNILFDYGNWDEGPTLQNQIEKISPILAKHLARHPMITLGGGHDYAAVDGAGFLNWQSVNPSRPLIINFDAHLDVRPWNKGLNSGTPFSWLLDHFPNRFDFLEVGIQKQCSSPKHHEWVKEKGGKVIEGDFIQSVGLLTALRQQLAGALPNQDCFISFDIDAFSQSLAPGCSQSWVGGLQYAEVIESLRWICQSKRVRLLGIYEVSPPLDIDNRTSKLAACLVNEFIISNNLP